MRIVFMGTPEFAVPSLESLVNSKYEVVMAVTQPDKPKGRGYRVCCPPVKQYALSKGIPVFQPEKSETHVRSGNWLKQIRIFCYMCFRTIFNFRCSKHTKAWYG